MCRGQVAAAALALAGLLGLVGCSSGHYRKSADKESYRILQAYEQQLFGRTNAFTIDTPYSDRKPEEILPTELIDSRTITNNRSANIEEVLRLGVRHSREYQNQKEQLYLTALSLTGSRYSFSPQFFAESTATINGVGDDLQTGSVRSRIGVSQLMKSGGRLSMSLANDLLRYYTGNAADGGDASVINLISVNLTQPLLRGFGRNDPSVEALTQAERNVVYGIRTYTLYQNQFARDIAATYFGLLGQKATVRNNYTNYLRRVDTTQYQESRSVDRARLIDVDDARNAELTARISYVNSVATYLRQLDAFKIRLGLPLSEELYLADRDLEELGTAGLIPVDIDRAEAFKMAVEAHMDVLNAIDRFEDSKRKVRVAADQLKADLGFFASGSLQSEGAEDYTKFDFDQLRYSAGLTLDLPIDRLRERNTYRSTLISFESQIRSLVTTLDNFKNRIDDGLRSIERDRLNYVSRQESLRVAERRVDNAEMLVKAGRSTIRDLRESQDQLISSQNALTDAIVSYHSTRLQFLLDVGVRVAEWERFWLINPLTDLLDETQRGRAPLEMPRDELIPPDQFLEPKS